MRKILSAGVLLVAVFVLSGCGVAGVLSKTETFAGADSFAIASPRRDILDVIAAVGEDMGMSVSALNKKAQSISFQSSSSGAGLMLVGSISRASLGVEVKDAGKTLDISTSTVGNFGNGGQAASTKLIEEFKTLLAKKLGQNI